MKTRSLLQLYSGPSGSPGEHGFRLTGRAKAGDGLCRVQLRFMEPWHRYPDPRLRSSTWDLRVYTRTDAAFELENDLTAEGLEKLVDVYEFPDGATALANLEPNGDPVHDRVLAWARKATGAPEVPAPTDINPAQLAVRYKKAEAKTVEIPRIPVGRPLPPGQSPLYLNAESTPLTSSGIVAGNAAPAAPTPRAAAKQPAARPAANPAAPKAAPSAPSAGTVPATGVKPPLPAKGAPAKSRQSLTERLSAIREQSEKNASSKEEDEKA